MRGCADFIRQDKADAGSFMMNTFGAAFHDFAGSAIVHKALIERESIQLDLKNQQTQLYSTIENYWLQATTNQNSITRYISHKKHLHLQPMQHEIPYYQ